MTKPVGAGSSVSPPSIQNPTVKRPAVKHEGVDPTLVAAAQGMESMFLDYMMKAMRQTVPRNEMDLESPATEIYRSMLDSEIADRAARTNGVGLADQLIDYLDPARYTRNVGNGGPHEGKSAELRQLSPGNGNRIDSTNGTDREVRRNGAKAKGAEGG